MTPPPPTADPRYAIALALALASFPSWGIGVAALARSKGYSGWLGLLGLLSVVGWGIVKILPDRWEERQGAGPRGDDYPRPT